MRLNKILLPTIILILSISYYIGFDYVYNTAVKNLLNQQIESSKYQSELISNLLFEKLAKGATKEEVKNELQHSLEFNKTDGNFVCMFDTTGKEICHPNKQKIGKVLEENNSVIKSIYDDKIETNFKKAIIDQKSIGGLRQIKNSTEIVYLSPVKNTDWIVASHFNVFKFKEILTNLKEKLSFIFIFLWLISSLVIYYFLHHSHIKSINELTELNRNIGMKYFNDLNTLNEKFTKSSSDELKNVNKRILADKGSKLTPVYLDNIAYIYTENKISHIVELNNEKSTINTSLDELLNKLDKNTFYRASRQVILSVKSIDKVEKYGTTQLKVLTNPVSDIKIIISKNKLKDFKNWLGKN